MTLTGNHHSTVILIVLVSLSVVCHNIVYIASFSGESCNDLFNMISWPVWLCECDIHDFFFFLFFCCCFWGCSFSFYSTIYSGFPDIISRCDLPEEHGDPVLVREGSGEPSWPCPLQHSWARQKAYPWQHCGGYHPCSRPSQVCRSIKMRP